MPINIFQFWKGREKKMPKDYVHIYKNRWNLIAEAENQEIREASPELLLKQTFSIWEIANSLDFFEQGEVPNTLWSQLQAAWMTHHA
jgi:hypothetical protein